MTLILIRNTTIDEYYAREGRVKVVIHEVYNLAMGATADEDELLDDDVNMMQEEQ